MNSAEREPASQVGAEELSDSLDREPKRAEPDAPDGQFNSQDMPTTDGEFIDANESAD